MQMMKLQGVPALYLFDNGEYQDQVVGLHPLEEYIEFFKKGS
jgi:hypothetical protein